MATKYKKNDYLMEKMSKEIVFVVKVTNREVMVRHEKNDEIELCAHHFINRGYIKVDKDMADTLYKDTETKK